MYSINRLLFRVAFILARFLNKTEVVTNLPQFAANKITQPIIMATPLFSKM
jgi:hypothetical protein